MIIFCLSVLFLDVAGGGTHNDRFLCTVPTVLGCPGYVVVLYVTSHRTGTDRTGTGTYRTAFDQRISQAYGTRSSIPDNTCCYPLSSSLQEKNSRREHRYSTVYCTLRSQPHYGTTVELPGMHRTVRYRTGLSSEMLNYGTGTAAPHRSGTNDTVPCVISVRYRTTAL